MQRDRVVDPGLDAVLSQPGSQAIAILHPDHEQVIHVAPALLRGRQSDRQVRQPLAVGVGQLPAAVVPPVEMRQLDPQHRRLQRVQPVVERGDLVLVLHPLPVVAQDARRVRDLGGIRD